MARAKGPQLVCHRHDSLVSYEDHHVWPLGYHGPNTRANIVRVCCNAHSDIHHLMERLLRGKPVDLTEYGPTIRQLALMGYEQVTAYADTLAQRYQQGDRP